MNRFTLPILSSLVLMGLAGAAVADVDADGVSAAPAVEQVETPLAPDSIGEDDPRAHAILGALDTLSGMDEDYVGTAIAQIMIAFTAVTEPDEFLRALDWWQDQASAAEVEGEAIDIDAAETLRVLSETSWISSGNTGAAVHYVMDMDCAPCAETLAALRTLNADGSIELRVTLLPLVSDETFSVALGLRADADTAWDRFTAYVDGDLALEDIAVEPSDDNLEVQAAIEADYDAFLATGIRTLPLTGFAQEDGEPRLILGAYSGDEARAMLLGE